MDTTRRRRLEQLMAAASHEPGVWLQLANEFHAELAGALRAAAVRRGWFPEPHELDGLVVQAATVLTSLAPSWRPDGALPWRWAAGRLNALVALEAPTTASASLDAMAPTRRDRVVELATVRRAPELPAPSFADEHEPTRVLECLAASDPAVALVRDALREVARPADVALFLEYRAQQAAGDPSPAATVGAPRGIAHAAVRQRVRRIQQRLDHLTTSDHRYAPLAGRALFSGAARVAKAA